MTNKFSKGVTLIEMLLVTVIVGTVIMISLRYMQQRVTQAKIDKTVSDMQQILNAGLAYYVANGTWPGSIACLQGSGASGCTINYLPGLTNNPYGKPYLVYGDTTQYANFYVRTDFDTTVVASPFGIATIVAGPLPLSFTAEGWSVSNKALVAAPSCSSSSTSCSTFASVNVPGSNLNNATAVNFAGLYHHGACVPVPTCPVNSNMTAQIMVVPVSVSGLNDANSTNVYPINSFTAYASGSPAANPPACANGGTAVACTPINGNAPSSGTYWRVCLQVVTEKGMVSVTNTGGTSSSSYPTYPWGGNVTLMAITRCALSNEPSGSSFTVFSQ